MKWWVTQTDFEILNHPYMPCLNTISLWSMFIFILIMHWFLFVHILRFSVIKKILSWKIQIYKKQTHLLITFPRILAFSHFISSVPLPTSQNFSQWLVSLLLYSYFEVNVYIQKCTNLLFCYQICHFWPISYA